MLIFTVPLITAQRLFPGSPWKTAWLPASAWVFGVAQSCRRPQIQDRKKSDALRSIANLSLGNADAAVFVVEHPGHNHLDDYVAHH